MAARASAGRQDIGGTNTATDCTPTAKNARRAAIASPRTAWTATAQNLMPELAFQSVAVELLASEPTLESVSVEAPGLA